MNIVDVDPKTDMRMMGYENLIGLKLFAYQKEIAMEHVSSALSKPLTIIRKIVRLSGLIKNGPISCRGQGASDLIKSYIDSDEPCMICRFGSVELEAVLTHLIIEEKNWLRKFQIFLKGGELDWSSKVSLPMLNNAGFFPADDSNLTRFSEQFLDDIQYIDILGSWLSGESVILRSSKNTITIPLWDIEPYYHEKPWSESLKGRKVLVISPFSTSIGKQYSINRARLFKDHRVLPEFDLRTLQAVQTIANNGVDNCFKSWFDALECMCEKINKIDFEIALIGAGAYGMALAAYVKKIGKKAVHMGGPTQIMFGIKGKRWDEIPFFKNLYNESWVRPSLEETPHNCNKVEDGCYW